MEVGGQLQKTSYWVKILRSSVKSLIKKRKEYETGADLPTAGCPHKLSGKKEAGREATKISATTMKELQASVGEMGETVHATIAVQILYQAKLFRR